MRSLDLRLIDLKRHELLVGEGFEIIIVDQAIGILLWIARVDLERTLTGISSARQAENRAEERIHSRNRANNLRGVGKPPDFSQGKI